MAQNTIKVKKYSDVIKEVNAAAPITPGHLIERTSAGKVQKHATQDGTAARIFALEDELQGKAIGDNYATDTPVQCWFPYPGDEVYALLANGENVSIGDKLTSNGDGTLKGQDVVASAAEEAPNSVICVALEAVDMSGSSGADPSGRIKVEIL